MAEDEKLRKPGTARRNEADEFREAFLERSALTSRIPDKMPNAERREIFTGIPRGQTGYGATTLVYPNPSANPVGFGGGDRDCGADGNLAQCPGQDGSARYSWDDGSYA